MEVVHDISMAAGHKLARGEIDVMDSRELFSRILEWAEEFMRIHEKSSWDSEDYIGAVDEFALMKLAEVYGSEEEAECDWCQERHAEKNVSLADLLLASVVFPEKHARTAGVIA